jgi:hypothetical protein
MPCLAAYRMCISEDSVIATPLLVESPSVVRISRIAVQVNLGSRSNRESAAERGCSLLSASSHYALPVLEYTSEIWTGREFAFY